ncbi:hypothetical protein OQA88_3095 [Cercophora sp. LCS_1]
MKVPGLGLTGAVDGGGVLRQIDWLRSRGGTPLDCSPREKYPVELQFFDPNVCTCLHFDKSPTGWAFNQREVNTDGVCPRHKNTPGLPAAFWYTARMSEWQNKPPNKAPIAPCYRGHSMSEWRATVCANSAECVVMCYEKRIALGRCQQCCSPKDEKKRHEFGPAWPGWVTMLDPGSYDLKEDEESFGTYWCDDETCRNYHALGAETSWKRVMALSAGPLSKSKLWKRSRKMVGDLLATILTASKAAFRQYI